MKKITAQFQKGFTLIELLIVIAILGVLAVTILAVLNPPEQLARSRDAGRKSAIAQLGRSVQSYYTSQDSVYPPQTAFWMTTGSTATSSNGLQSTAEIKSPPSNPTASGYTISCFTGALQNGYCYRTNSTDAIVYARAESNSEKTKAACSTGQITWIVWSSELGKTGLTCTTASTDPAITGLAIQ